jgi:hypothetical protein
MLLKCWYPYEFLAIFGNIQNMIVEKNLKQAFML